MRNRFTRAALAVILISFLFFSCKKNKDSGYYVKFKINGAWVTWKDALGEIGPDLADSKKTNFGLTAMSDDEKNAFDITLQVGNTVIPPGTYSSDNYDVSLLYFKNINSVDAEYYRPEAVTGRPDPLFTVTLTTVTDKQIRGTFTGNYLVEMTSGEIVEITEGEFFLPDVYQ
jgi:hypothetical protein